MKQLENQELIQKLIDNGFGHFVETFLTQEKLVFTKRGRLNKSSSCRQLGWKNKELETAMEKMRNLLEKDF